MGKSKAKSPRKGRVDEQEHMVRVRQTGRINARSESGRQERTWPNVSVENDDNVH